MMTVIVLKVGLGPEVKTIGSTLDAMRSEVGGHIEAVKLPFLPTGVIVYCDEEGRAKGLPPNRWGLLGTLLVVRLQGRHEMSLTPADVSAIKRLTTTDVN